MKTPQIHIPQRDEMVDDNLIDLSMYYTDSLDEYLHQKVGNTLSDLPKGNVEIEGVVFDIRGCVQLAGKYSFEITGLKYPQSINNIPINKKLFSIQILHASAWNIESEMMEIGEYVISFENNTQISFPIIYKKNIWDWWSGETDNSPSPAWVGTNARTMAISQHIRLFIGNFINPFPELSIKNISLVSNCKGPGSMIIAISTHKINTFPK